MNNISNLQDLCNLKFFSDSGIEIYAEKQYIITWKLITNNKSLYQIPEGYILGDIEKAQHISRKTGEIIYEYYRLRPDTLVLGFTKQPKIIIPPYQNGKNENGIDPDNAVAIREKITRNILLNANGKPTQVEITINLQNSPYTLTVDSALFFNFDSLKYDKPLRINTGYNDDDDDNNNEYTLIYSVTDIEFFKIKDVIVNDELKLQFGTWDEIKPGDDLSYIEFDSAREPHPYIYYLLEPDERGVLNPENIKDLTKEEYYNNAYIDAYENRTFVSKVQGIAQMFPFIRYNGSFMQEKTSAGFIAANTLIIFEEKIDESCELTYERPALESDNGWLLSLECIESGELKFIEVNADNEIKQVNDKQYRLSYVDGDIDRIYDPITAAFGVVAEDEGCYLNFIGLYIHQQNEPDIPFFMGMITVKTEIIGEDERYRTLLENFGIPDPIKYTKVFYDSEFSESLPDYQLVNEKSKELMLTYDQIFPYAGTYKALINSLLFLGYTDIIIKEWYKFFDTNDRERDIAFDAVDVRQNKVADLLYKKYKINANDNSTRLSKLNWLSIVYHINELILNNELEEIGAYEVDATTNQILTETKLYFDTLQTLPIYAYRTEEITAKLYYLKKWLESYIIGLNARIIEITGEGVYYAPMKAAIYSTGNMLLDFTLTEYATPKVLSVSPFTNSTSEITCTVAELNNIRFKEFGHKTFGYFTLKEISYTINETDLNFNISNSVDMPVYGDEFQFDLKITPESGIIYQPRTLPKTNALIIRNNNLEILNNSSKEIIFDKPLPIISVETGNIRKLTGTWERNVEWLILERVDAQTYETIYYVKNIGTYDEYPDEISHHMHVKLVPTENAELKYTTDNKWRAPMLVIKGYKFDIDLNKYHVHPEYFEIPKDNEYIIEIIKGRISFSYMPKKSGTNKANILQDIPESIEQFNTEILFKPDYQKNQWYQKIDVQYTYTSEKQSLKPFNITAFDEYIKNYLYAPAELTKAITDKDVYDYALKQVNYTIGNKYLNDYLKNTKALTIFKEELEKLKQYRIKSYLNTRLLKIYELYYKSNKSITIPVHHIGDYDVTVKMYDRYNNIYINQKKDYAHVNARPFDFSLFVNLEYSNNSPDFCERNMKGDDRTMHPVKTKLAANGYTLLEKVSAKEPVTQLLKDWTYIKYPIVYDLYDIQNNKDDRDVLSYYNYTYALNPPAYNNTIILSNHAIEIKNITYDKVNNLSIISIYDMSDKNKRLLLVGELIIIAVYDKNNITSVDNLGPFTIELSRSVDACNYEGEIVISSELISLNSNYNYYIINTTEYEITLRDIILSDDKLYDRFIIPGETGKQHYMKNDVIKVNYYCNIISYHTITFPYEKGTVLYNALYDPLYPVLAVRYKDPKKNRDIQYHKGHDNHDVILDDILDIELLLLFEYLYYDDAPIMSTNNYREGKWTVTDLLEHLQNSEFYNIISWENTIKPILDGTPELVSGIYQSTDVIFSNTNKSCDIRFADETVINTLYNSVSYRIIDVIANKKYVKSVGYVYDYMYVLNKPLDVWFMQKYGNPNIYNTKIKIMYPYSDQVHYHAYVTKDAEEKEEQFGVYNYSLIKTSFEFDVDNMFLDNYIDNNFIARVYKFDPDYLKNIKIEPINCIFMKDNITVYEYKEMPITVPTNTPILVKPYPNECFDKNDNLISYTWEWKYRVFTNESEYFQEDMKGHTTDTLFMCNNTNYCIAPKTTGPHDIILSVSDKFGNILVNNSTGRLFIK